MKTVVREDGPTKEELKQLSEELYFMADPVRLHSLLKGIDHKQAVKDWKESVDKLYGKNE